MGVVASINQTGTGIRLPNFCNLGVMLRALLVVNLFVFGAAAMRTRTLEGYWFEFLVLAAFVEPALILSLVVLCAARRPLHAMGYGPAIVVIALFEVAVAWLMSETVAQATPFLETAAWASRKPERMKVGWPSATQAGRDFSSQ